MQQLLTQSQLGPQPLLPASQGAAQPMHIGADSTAERHLASSAANNPWAALLGARYEAIGGLTFQMLELYVGQHPEATAADLIQLGH